MMIDEHHVKSKGHRLRTQKEIKVKIPIEYHLRLHTVKVVDGQSISETVQAALENYFASVAPERAAAVPAGDARAPTPVAAPLLRAP